MNRPDLPDAEAVLRFWFEETTPKQWFAVDAAFDALIAERGHADKDEERGYRWVGIEGYQAHLARSRNPLDNRRENLRFVTHSANCLNSRKRRGTSSAHKGVSRSGDKWQVVVRVDGKLKWIGKYATEAEAAAVAAPFFSDVAHNPTSRAA